MTKQKYILYFFTFFLTTLLVDAQNFCGTGTGDPGDTGDPECNDNAFINSHNDDPNEIDPATIEYDNIISGGYATIAREANGQFIIWGRNAAPNGTSNLYTPTLISEDNGYHYDGDPLKAALGSHSWYHQFALLTTTGLYVWGRQGTLITGSVTTSTSFGPVEIATKGFEEHGKNPTGLPYGVDPLDVKMMFGAYGTLAIVTCSGEAWILTTSGGKKGDGTTNNNDANLWHRIKKEGGIPLENVVAMRGTSRAMMALTSDGEMYTWGTGTFLGDGQPYADRKWATKMEKPEGKTPKMIGMTNPNISDQMTYYMLATDGNLYSLGADYHKQLGNWGGTSISYVWVQPRKGSATGPVFDDVVWISPSEHDGAKLPGYGYSGRGAINVLTKDKKLYAWGDNDVFLYGGPNTGNHDPVYMPGTYDDEDELKETDNVIAVETGGNFSIIIREGSPEFGFVGRKSGGNIGDGDETYDNGWVYVEARYKFIAPLNVCGAPTSPTIACYKPGNFTSDSTGLSTNIGITSLRNSNTDGWPQVRKGAWIALESKTKGFVPNRLSTTQITSIEDPVEGMMVYNTDQDCLQIYVDAINGWKCFNVQSCD